MDKNISYIIKHNGKVVCRCKNFRKAEKVARQLLIPFLNDIRLDVGFDEVGIEFDHWCENTYVCNFYAKSHRCDNGLCLHWPMSPYEVFRRDDDIARSKISREHFVTVVAQMR